MTQQNQTLFTFGDWEIQLTKRGKFIIVNMFIFYSEIPFFHRNQIYFKKPELIPQSVKDKLLNLYQTFNSNHISTVYDHYKQSYVIEFEL